MTKFKINKNCINGEKLLKYLRNTTITAKSGVRYTFNEKGDMNGVFQIIQFNWVDKNWKGSLVGTFSELTGELNMLRNFNVTSICSLPCPKKHIKIPQSLKCCWLCKQCRENEILINNRTECKKCPKFFWPGTIQKKNLL